VSLEVEYGEAADVAEPVNVDRELAEEVDDLGRAARQREPEHERRRHDAEQLLRVDHDLHDEQLPECSVHALRVQRVLPRVGKVVRVLYDDMHERLWVEYAVLVGDHPARDGEYGAEEPEVEEHGAVRCDLEVEEEVRVEHGREQEHRRKRARDERDEAAERQRLGSSGRRKAYRMRSAIFSFGNWAMYMFAVGYDSSRRRANR
jgi:hypothetical protein